MQKKNIKDSVLKMTETNKSFNKCDTFLSIACMIFFSTAVFLQFGIENIFNVLFWLHYIQRLQCHQPTRGFHATCRYNEQDQG